MSQQIASLLDESIQLEKNLSKLYTLFNDQFPDDEDFWWQLALEENSHAALLLQEKKQPRPLQFFPENLLSNDLKTLRDTNAWIMGLLARLASTPCSREEALNYALQLELSAGEAHFQDFMESDTGSLSDDIFRQLAAEDRNHAARIRTYMSENNILASSPSHR